MALIQDLAASTIENERGIPVISMREANTVTQNAFNTYKTISQPGQVSLKLSDFMGNKLAEIPMQQRTDGDYTDKFDVSNLASGVYFLTLSWNGITQTEKLLISK